MSEPLFVGVDVGTQSAKAALFELSGACLSEAAVTCPCTGRAADEVEQEPEDFYRAATACDCVLCCQLGSPRRCRPAWRWLVKWRAFSVSAPTAGP